MPKRNIIWILAILAATAGAMWISRSSPYSPAPTGTPGPHDDLVKVLATIEADYYHALDPAQRKALRVKAVRALAESLDEYTTYFPPGRFKSFERRMDGFGHGLGLRTRTVPGQPPVITAVLYDSPADRAEVKVGQKIVRVGERPAAEFEARRLREVLAPPPGQSVLLVLGSRAGDGELSITLTSAEFRIESVTGLCRLGDQGGAGRWDWSLDADRRIAYIHVREFVNDTAEKFRQTLRTAGDVKGLVLDLRGNPGGKSSVAMEFADMFLPEGLIVRTLERDDAIDSPDDGTRYTAHKPGTIDPIPVVVLVDEQTSSGAEVVAGALWANHRAVVVGMRTRGKGCIQTMIELPGDLGLLNLTTAQFVLGRGGPIARTPESTTWGVTPHKIVAVPQASRQALAELRAEAQRPPEPAPDAKTTPPVRPRKVANLPARLLELDTQLAAALDLLKRFDTYEALIEAERARARRQAAARKAASDARPGDDE